MIEVRAISGEIFSAIQACNLRVLDLTQDLNNIESCLDDEASRSEELFEREEASRRVLAQFFLHCSLERVFLRAGVGKWFSSREVRRQGEKNLTAASRNPGLKSERVARRKRKEEESASVNIAFRTCESWKFASAAMGDGYCRECRKVFPGRVQGI